MFKTNQLTQRTGDHYTGSSSQKAGKGDTFASEEYAQHHKYGYKIACSVVITSSLSTQDAGGAWSSDKSAERQVRQGVLHHERRIGHQTDKLLYYRMKDRSKGGEFVVVVIVNTRVDLLNQQFWDALQTGPLPPPRMLL